MRVPRAGGLVRAYRFTALDSTIWRSTHNAPAVDRVLAFDQENGLLAFTDTTGYPGWIDLRLGSVRRPTRASFATLSSGDGWSIYGTTTSGSLVRMTPSGEWQSPMVHPVRRVLPAADGNVILVAERSANDALLFRVRPPDESVTDSMAVSGIERSAVTQVGDRAYVTAGNQVWSVSPSDLTGTRAFTAPDEILALAPTPSGDRVFFSHGGAPRLERLDRYTGELHGSARLPGLATELRMDPLGRYLLARPVTGDTAWVVDVGTEEVVGSVTTRWRADLPAVAFDGSVAAWRGTDVVFSAPRSGEELLRVKGGASDLWFFMRWNGFRPRAKGIDQPVAFRAGEPRAEAAIPGVSEGLAAPAAPAQSPPAPATPPPAAEEAVPETPPARGRGWILSFAAVLSPERAQALVAQISVNGARPRISTSEADGTTVYRVIMGPFPTREDAERAGRSSGHSFWVYETGGGN